MVVDGKKKKKRDLDQMKDFSEFFGDPDEDAHSTTPLQYSASRLKGQQFYPMKVDHISGLALYPRTIWPQLGPPYNWPYNWDGLICPGPISGMHCRVCLRGQSIKGNRLLEGWME